MDIRFERTQYMFHILLLKDGDVIDKRKGSDDRHSFFFFEDGTPFSFQFSDRTVAVEGDYQNIPLPFCLFKVTDVSDMDKVKTPVGQNDPLALFF